MLTGCLSDVCVSPPEDSIQRTTSGRSSGRSQSDGGSLQACPADQNREGISEQLQPKLRGPETVGGCWWAGQKTRCS